jgi:hypothetical protein
MVTAVELLPAFLSARGSEEDALLRQVVRLSRRIDNFELCVSSSAEETVAVAMILFMRILIADLSFVRVFGGDDENSLSEIYLFIYT